ncbi:Coenzyme A transferase OS=Tsukamurella paurometabola (strain ATCC 8368 / DSM / CCUG 35730 /CIP 100753 / JCM 10117 / KCTC 9821 / NBRC 16120 / NCIMB 702349/ NCTC 13040) OX=521096 GN=Tpau_2996 PE=4 SV=1 [Tsukamurella paurometabola]|uniref:Coenzyme A transferase n=1 Tax=Tsukamurella paurometabola (strain ATCC 8368 / DSM 20162 / CCUG 35730 / CIP 100753 / JCM 10117 / KCTC 9821 / NBRC 16120 / NCIMB 702349 / NCTC 13040) TaxID=521096 RepID=D5UU88_TSUPD|nr:acyl CoA:acetate/3-ketoacid CoA transferase [Tsukamurella paurometabola]ADG79591.1 coenzyme A transferase [Tsukamurella paurometabola DSM 20162]SUP36358.1 Probable succinyl-CoA:3-ketoacid-coenzyme A transferase subunit A [Tsukamurella paurometabola]
MTIDPVLTRTSASPIRDKVVTADEAVRLIRNGDYLVVEGFAGQGYAEELVLALERRYLASGNPKDLSLVFTVAQGDRGDRGFVHLCHDGMLKRSMGGHYGMAPALQKLAVSGGIEAYNLPQGVLAQLVRDTGAGKPGLLTRVGLGTFADPRLGGGKVNDITVEDRVRIMEIDGEEYLFYKAFDRLDVAFLRGTTADPAGNVTMEKESLTLEALEIAIAVHNKGGLVIVQVERIAERGSLHPRDVKIPGVLVDCVVLATSPERHTQSWGSQYNPSMSGEIRQPMSRVAAMPLDPRKVIARRAAMELRPNSVVNLGIGVPEGVAAVATEEGILDYLTLTAEPGVIGGMPAGGTDFGSAVNPDAILAQPSQFDFYDGGGLDAAFLGLAQADQHGNVNVSRFGPRLAGAGGFINISQNAKAVYFLGTFLAPAHTEVVDGAIVTTQGPAAPKFLKDVDQRTFSGEYAVRSGQPVMFITERCVFVLTERGMELTEIAPGVDLQRDVLDLIEFEPVMDTPPVTMDARIFRDQPMGLGDDLLTVPLEARFSYDEKRNIFFLNLEGIAVRTEEDIQGAFVEIDQRLAAIGRQVNMVVNYDNFSLPPELADSFAACVRTTNRYCETVTRYTTSAFLRLKLADHLADRGLAPHLYESRGEAISASHSPDGGTSA